MTGGELTPPPAVPAAFGPPFAAARWVGRGGGFSGAAVFAGFVDPLPDPAFCRRLAVLRDWRAAAPAPRVGPELADLVSRTLRVLPALADDAERRLAPWADRPVPVQPCLCDIHHDHVLFAGDEVTGIIDY